MQKAIDRASEMILSIDAALYREIFEEESGRVAGYLLALEDFDILDSKQIDQLKKKPVCLRWHVENGWKKIIVGQIDVGIIAEPTRPPRAG